MSDDINSLTYVTLWIDDLIKEKSYVDRNYKKVSRYSRASLRSRTKPTRTM
jgi:hypothetical protein